MLKIEFYSESISTNHTVSTAESTISFHLYTYHHHHCIILKKFQTSHYFTSHYITYFQKVKSFLWKISGLHWVYHCSVVLDKTLESPLDCMDIKPVNLKENQPWILIGRLTMKLNLQYFGHLMWRADSLEKVLMLGKTEGRRGRGWLPENKMVGWHHRLSGHEFEQAPGDGEGQGSPACCSPWGQKWVNSSHCSKDLI